MLIYKARVDLQQESFTGGAWSPWVQSRYSAGQRASAVAAMRNMIPTLAGPATRRPGTLYVGTLGSEPCRLIPFDVSRNRSYVLALFPGRLRIYTLRSQVLNSAEEATPLELVTPWTADELEDLHWARAGDRLWVTVNSRKPQEIARHDDNDWRLTEVAPLFGRNDTVVFNDTDWPRLCAFHQNRLVFASTRLNPQTVWLSQVSLYTDFRQRNITNPVSEVEEPAPDSRLILTLAGGNGDRIEWLRSHQRGLMLGTGGDEWLITGNTRSGSITPDSAGALPASTRGAAGSSIVGVDNEILFIGRTTREVRALAYQFESDGLLSQDITVFARHLVEDGIAELAWQRAPEPIVWARMTDGTLRSCLYDRAQNVVGWSTHDLADGGVIESMACVPEGPGGDYDLWLVVRRTRGSTPLRTLEVIPGRPLTPGVGDDAYVDLATTCTCDPPGDTLTGLSHLEGQTVAVVSGGARIPDATVTGGQITLDRIVSDALLGLPYTSELELLPAGSSQLGAWGGKRTRYHRVLVDLLDTMEGAEIAVSGGRAADWVPLSLRVVGEPMDEAPALVTGTVKVEPVGDIDRQAGIALRSTTPGPMTVRAVMVSLETYER